MITTVTLNTAIDKAYRLDQDLTAGKVMRVVSVQNTAGGKGLNVARVVRLCGEKTLATGFAGGFNGSYLESLLDADGIPHDFCRVEKETRSCVNVLDKKLGSTELLEPGFEITREEERDFLSHFELLLKKSDWVVISGSMPRGASPDLYARMIAMTKAQGKPVALDTSGKSLALGLEATPTVIKPNQDEIASLFGREIRDRKEALASAKELYGRGIPYVLISLGGEGAVLICKEGTYHALPPRVEVANTVGCGDSMVGGFVVALSRGASAEKALKYSVAVATACAMNEKTGCFDPVDRDYLLDRITVSKI